MLTGKVALVTGAARGIGRSIARRLTADGALVVAADIDAAGAVEAADELTGGGATSVPLALDVADAGAATAAVDFAVATYGSIDIVVNNAAAVGPRVRLLDLDIADWDAVHAANVRGPFALSRAAARQMVQRGRGGCVVNISAIQRLVPLPTYGAYSASKGALEALTRALAVELGEHGVRVNAIEVGSVFGPSTAEALDLPVRTATGDVEEVPPHLDEQAATLLRRMGRGSEVAAVVAFLVSDDASWVTGSIIRADGGRLLARPADPLTPVDMEGG